MAATFQFVEHNGAPDQSSAIAGTVTTQCNWKSVDDVATGFNDAPLVVGTNSYEKWQFGRITGHYTQLLNGKFAHTAGTLPANVTLFGSPTMTTDSDRRIYATPSRSVGTGGQQLTDITVITPIAQGAAVWFGLNSPGASGKVATFGPPASDSAYAYTNYLTTQLRVGSGASSGAGGPITLTVRFDEN